MKTKKLNLNKIKVESFVTSMNEKERQTVDGGGTTPLSDLLGDVCIIGDLIQVSINAITLCAGTIVVGTIIGSNLGQNSGIPYECPTLPAIRCQTALWMQC